MLSKRNRKSNRLLFSTLCGWVLSGVLFGCAGIIPQNWRDFQAVLPARHTISHVPFIPQKAYQCGPAVLAMVLQYHHVPVGLEVLDPQVYTPSLEGSLQPALIAAARKHGMVTHVIDGIEHLLKELHQGFPVIVLQNLGLSWYPVWHYAVVVGYDREQGIIRLHSGLEPDREISIRLFDRTWSRSRYWGLVVSPPSRVPATATEMSFIESVMILEKTGQWPSAVIGYQTALTRWPENLYARIGLGNSYYGMGDLESASGVFHETIHMFPGSAAAFNNLAQVLFEQGKKQEALEAATTAVTLGGSNEPIYIQTYEEIKAGLQ